VVKAVLQHGHVRADAAVEFAHTALREEVHGQLHQVLVGILSQPGQHVLQHRCLQREDAQQQQRHRVDVAKVEQGLGVGGYIALGGIDQPAHQPREHHAQHAVQQEQHHADAEGRAIRAQVAEQPEELAQRALVQLRRFGVVVLVALSAGGHVLLTVAIGPGSVPLSILSSSSRSSLSIFFAFPRMSPRLPN
jgi:hypothetical protein